MTLSSLRPSAALRVLSMLLFGIALSACSSDPYADYIGLWQLKDQRHPQVALITRDGDALLFTENVLPATKPVEGPENLSCSASSILIVPW